MEHWTLLISLVVLFTGIFVLKKLWLGALAGIIILCIERIFFSAINISDAFVSSIIISAELALLLIGAYLFYNTLASRNHFKSFIDTASGFSSRLSSVIILCWFLGSFMEGIAGFGIPAMLIAPLMLTVGFKPLTSIVLPLAAGTTAVTFGALGTPLKIGLGISSMDATVVWTVVLNLLPAMLMPFALAFLFGKTEGTRIDWSKEWKVLLGAGTCFVVPYLLTSLVSMEYPSVSAGALGLTLFVFFFVPDPEKPPLIFWWKVFYPYLLFVVFLILTKFLLSEYTLEVSSNFKAISLYQPGVVFIVAAFLYLRVENQTDKRDYFARQVKTTLLQLGKPLFTIFLLVCFAQLLQGDLTVFIHEVLTVTSRKAELVLIPLAGVTGSFITGSATMSNLLLTNGVQASTKVGPHLPLLLALLHTGSAIGNAISFQNIVMVKSVVTHPVSLAQVMGYNFGVVLFYVMLVTLGGFILTALMF